MKCEKHKYTKKDSVQNVQHVNICWKDVQHWTKHWVSGLLSTACVVTVRRTTMLQPKTKKKQNIIWSSYMSHKKTIKWPQNNRKWSLFTWQWVHQRAECGTTNLLRTSIFVVGVAWLQFSCNTGCILYNNIKLFYCSFIALFLHNATLQLPAHSITYQKCLC